MANRDNHYELAFERYLRERQIPYVAVDEARRSLLAGGSLKSLDFIVSPPESHAAEPGPEDNRRSWLIDVKGRRFPSGDEQKQYWKNWSTRDDLVSLSRWESLFGGGFAGLFVFAYCVVGDRSPLPAEDLFAHDGNLYGFVAIRLTHYVRAARPISPAWDTLAMPTADFRRHAAPVDSFF